MSQSLQTLSLSRPHTSLSLSLFYILSLSPSPSLASLLESYVVVVETISDKKGTCVTT